MEVFVRVAECGSFAAAAKSLGLANATVTTVVKTLEEHLRVTLIRRDTQRLRLTEEGEIFLARARELLKGLLTAEEEVRACAGELAGWLHVEALISVGQALLIPALPVFAQRYPGISLAISLTNYPKHMIESGIDVAIRMESVEDAELVARPIYRSRYVACCTPALAAALPAHPADLPPTQCIGILPDEGRLPNPWAFERDGDKVALQPSGPVHFNSSDALLAAAEDGAGLACVMDVFANPRIAGGTLVRVYPDWEMGEKTFYIVTTKARETAKVKAFSEFLFEILAADRVPAGSHAVAVRSLGRRRA